MAAGILHYLKLPFLRYNTWLDRRPVLAKSITSGFMYAAGDFCAQAAETYRTNKENKDNYKPFTVNWKRLGIFFVYGTLIAGPTYHVWFARLDTLPAAMYQLRQHRQRGEVLRAYALLKRHGIEVNLKLEKLPSAKPFSKWAERGMKIAADQLLFSSLYALVFFISIGMLTGTVDKFIAEQRMDDLKDYEAMLHARYRNPKSHHEHVIEKNLLELKEKLEEEEDEHSIKSIDNVLEMLREEQSKKAITWSAIWEETWRHTKEKYLETFAMDCTVWPPLQLINFSFVPVQYQFLFVNAANLLWNTYLSLQANDHH